MHIIHTIWTPRVRFRARGTNIPGGEAGTSPAMAPKVQYSYLPYAVAHPYNI